MNGADNFYNTYLHEIFHALGFTGSETFVDNQNYIYPSKSSDEKLIPKIFDKFIYGANHSVSLKPLIQELFNWRNNNPNGNITDPAFSKELQTSKKLFKYHAHPPPAVIFKGKQKNYTLFTEKDNTFFPGSSISHFDWSLNKTEDVVMMHGGTAILPEYFPNDYKYYPIGRGIIDVLNTLGWPTRENPKAMPDFSL